MNFEELAVINIKRIDPKTITITEKTVRWCQLPYPGHKKGCPNYNKNENCPPNSPNALNIIPDYNKFYLIYAIFNFKKYVHLRRREHPQWSEKQLKCVLYWQSSIKKLLKEIINYIKTEKDYIFSCGSGFGKSVYSMEACRIDVFKTLRNNKIKPKNQILLVCLLCRV